MSAHLQTWLRRYLPAEAVSLVAAMLAGTAAAMLSGTNPAIIALAGAWGETTSYYATMLLRERRANPRQPVWRTLANLAVEFGVAELLDSLFLRPTLMYLAGQVVSDARLGVLIGKLAADVVFYIPTITIFELRRHYVDREPCTARRRSAAWSVVGPHLPLPLPSGDFKGVQPL
jgi:hypothetical protein